MSPLQMLPIVEPCPLEIFIRNAKAKLPDEVQITPGPHAGSPNVPGVLRNFWLNQGHVKKRRLFQDGIVTS